MRALNFFSPDGFRGTAQTIRAMHALTRDAIVRPETAKAAGDLVRSVSRRDYAGEAAALLRHLQQDVRYVRDPHLPEGLERVQHPLVTLFERRGGDCDDLSCALAALAGAIGFPYAFRTVGDDARRPEEFRHVYVALNVPGRGWLAADPSFEQPLGWEPARSGVVLLPDGTQVAPAAVERDWHP